MKYILLAIALYFLVQWTDSLDISMWVKGAIRIIVGLGFCFGCALLYKWEKKI